MRPWAFERVPNKIIRGADNALIYTSTKEACLSACLNEVRFHTDFDLVKYSRYSRWIFHFVLFLETFRVPFGRI